MNNTVLEECLTKTTQIKELIKKSKFDHVTTEINTLKDLLVTLKKENGEVDSALKEKLSRDLFVINQTIQSLQGIYRNMLQSPSNELTY